ncbi:phosphohydrolase [Paucibacter sp. R3-3]|uniref:Phosphohydrolase n=1 Tax=Roseateles agri TaxID=3098619 RepID=A0ABU5DDS5_9BURK|nr:phosphohydrolase [Paucibacter sp. R3-3]MDY0744437.1 phosphohydrolase [Paucibacter sp. R3-3]
MKHWQDLIRLFERHGHVEYAGEGVTQWQHAWQCGQLARNAYAVAPLQLAAWLHDIGHLLDGEADTPTLHGHDDRHEARAAALLAPLFGDAVARPVALHVEAKRYLVTRQPDYAARLSADSVRSLALQGGPMGADEAERWRAQPHADDALRLRAWDDQAKSPARWPPSREQALEQLAALMAHCAGVRR